MRATFARASSFVIASLITASLLAAEPADQLRRDVRDALQDSMRLTSSNRDAVVHRLVELYGRLATADSVGDTEGRRMQHQLRARLTRLSSIIRRQIELDAAAVGQAVPDKAAQAMPDKAVPANLARPVNQILAQRIVPPAGAGLPAAFAGGARPAAFGVAPNRAAALQPPDNGQALVDLIQRTIAPASWDVNGGPGSIVYFQPSRVLVVRQRSEVHHQLQGVVRALRQ